MKKSDRNISRAECILINDEKEDFGHAAFHMQQAVELAAKACIFRFGLDAFLIGKNLSNRLFYWNDEPNTIIANMRRYLEKRKRGSWMLTRNLNFVRKANLININHNSDYLSLMLHRSEQIIKVSESGEVIGKLYFRPGPRQRVGVYSDDITVLNHYPILTIVEECLAFCISTTNNKKSKVSPKLRLILNAYQNSINQLLEFMRYAKSDDGKVEVWKLSLGLDQDGVTKRLVRKLEEFEDNRVEDQLSDFAMKDFRNSILRSVFQVRKMHRNYLIDMAILPQVKAILRKHYFTETLADSYIDRHDDRKFELESGSFIKDRGELAILTSIYSPNGILADIEKIDRSAKMVKFMEVILSMRTFGKRYAWLAYLANIGHTLIFLLPHEDIGRYPTMVDSQNSDYIYSQNRARLLELLSETKNSCNKIKDMIYYEPRHDQLI